MADEGGYRASRRKEFDMASSTTTRSIAASRSSISARFDLSPREQGAVGVNHLADTWNDIGELVDLCKRLKAGNCIRAREGHR
jgi:hypothetical protein